MEFFLFPLLIATSPLGVPDYFEPDQYHLSYTLPTGQTVRVVQDHPQKRSKVSYIANGTWAQTGLTVGGAQFVYLKDKCLRSQSIEQPKFVGKFVQTVQYLDHYAHEYKLPQGSIIVEASDGLAVGLTMGEVAIPFTEFSLGVSESEFQKPNVVCVGSSGEPVQSQRSMFSL